MMWLPPAVVRWLVFFVLVCSHFMCMFNLFKTIIPPDYFAVARTVVSCVVVVCSSSKDNIAIRLMIDSNLT